MRLVLHLFRLALTCVAVSGCGALTPALFAPSRLAPDVVPPRDASAAVVTARGATGGLAGRAIDAATGAPVPGLRVRSGSQETVTDADGAFALSAAGARLAGAYPGYLPFDASLGNGAPASDVLIVLAPDPEVVPVVVQSAP